MLERLGDQRGELLATIGRLAPGGAWLVGGPVRDLALGRDFDDVDLCVDTPAGEFADRLSVELGGNVLHHESFGTATWRDGDTEIDLATTRRERYSAPAALPEVEPASLEEDLARRDFTVNAMALDLTPARWGELTDPFGGMRDLRSRRLRVLHERSFHDDPTRAFRGVRFATRLDFELEPPPAEALAHVARLSAARLGRELRLILGESGWSQAMALIARHGMLDALQRGWPGEQVDWQAAERAAQEHDPGDPAGFGQLVLLVAAPPTRRDELAARIEARKALRRDVATSVAAEQGLALLRGRPSILQLHDLLGSFDPAPLHALALCGHHGDDLIDYLARRRRAAPRATSRRLIDAGVAAGPALGRARTAIERARIENPELTLDEELAIARGFA